MIKPLPLKSFFLSLLSLVFISTTSFAQTKPEEDVNEIFNVSLEELLNVGMISASKKKQSVLDAPATAHVFTEQQIVLRGYSTLIDLLEDVPEVEIQRNSNPESRNLVTFRGVSGNEKFLILLNGIRITPSTGDSYTLGSNFSLVNAKRVEVIIGPASALYGVDAFSGVINIITKSQEGTVFKGVDGQLSYGQFKTADGSFIGGIKADKLNFTLSGHYNNSSEPKYSKYYKNDFAWYTNQFQPNGLVAETPFYNDVYNVSYFQRNAGESFRGDSLNRGFNMPSSSHFISAEVTYDKFTVGYVRHSESHSSAYGIQPKFTAYEKDQFFAQTQNVFYAKHQYQSFNKKWGLLSTLTQSMYEIDPNSNFIGASTRWQRGYVYANGQSSKIEEQFNYDFSSKVSMVVGASFENLNSLPRTGSSPKPFEKNQPATNQDLYYIGAAGYNPYAELTDTIAFNDSLALKQSFYYLNYQNYGAYAQFQISPVKFLDITLGSRFDHNTRFGSTVNPRLGLVISPTKKIRIKVLYGESFLAPSPEKAYRQAGAFFGPIAGDTTDAGVQILSADYLRVPNSKLKPEKLKSLELSLGMFLTQNFSVNFNGAYTHIDNTINQNGEASKSLVPDNINASRLETSVNQGYQEIYSFTSRVNYLIRMGKWSFTPYGAYSYMDGYNKVDYNQGNGLEKIPLVFAAQNTFKGGLEIEHKRFSVAPRVIYRSPSYSNVLEIRNQAGSNYKNDAYTVVNLTVRYLAKIKGKLRLTLFVKANNLLDARYYNVYSGNEEGMNKTPQDPIRVVGGLQFNLH